MKLGLGTVQFGLDYGISNQSGQTDLSEVQQILETANTKGIRVIDTAALYGTSEQVLGQTWPPHDSFSVVTKSAGFDKFPVIESSEAQALEERFYLSLKRLNKQSLYGFLIHHVNDLFKPHGDLLFHKMMELKQTGLVKKIGASIYTAQDIDKLLDNYQVDLIQLPINVLDQRLLLNGHLKKLKQYGIEIHARSAFLQGLLLMDPDQIPAYFDSIKEHLQNYHHFLKENQLTSLQAAINFVSSLPEIDAVIVGVNNCKQLEEICSIQGPCQLSFQEFALEDENVLNPALWRNR